MSVRKTQRERDEARLADAVARLTDALDDRDRILRETASTMSRRRAGEIASLTRSRVQQIINAPWTHRVRFVGYLDDEAAEALKRAGVELRFSRGAGSVGSRDGELPRPNKHSVYLNADSVGEARMLVEQVLGDRGQFFDFKVEPVSPSS